MPGSYLRPRGSSGQVLAAAARWRGTMCAYRSGVKALAPRGGSGVIAGASVSRAVAGPERWVPKNGSDLLPAGKSGAGGKNRLGHQGIRTPSPFFL